MAASTKRRLIPDIDSTAISTLTTKGKRLIQQLHYTSASTLTRGNNVLAALSRRTLTLDIDSNAIRLLTTKGKRVDKWASASIEPGIIEGGIVLDPPALGTEVKQLMESSQIKGKKVIVSLSGLYSICRILPVTPLDGQSTHEAVLQTARQIMPRPDDLYFSWQMIATSELERQAFIFGTPQDIINSEVQALKSVKINPYIINLKGIALMRLVDRKQALIVNKEPDSMDIVLIANGIPSIMHNMPLRQNMSSEEWVEHLGQVLERTVYFYNSQHPLSPLSPDTPLFLTGQLPGYLKIVQMVHERTNCPIAPPAIPLEYPPNLPVFQYAVNIGLAMQQISTPKMIKDEQSLDED